MSNNDGWGKGEDWVVTEGVSTDPKWPDEVIELSGKEPHHKVDWGSDDPWANQSFVTIDGQAIPARIVGDLAIHDSVGNPDCFCITHIPTLTSFMTAVPVEQNQEYETYELVDWCQKVQDQHQQFWQVLHELIPLTANRNTDREMRAKGKIKEWCLSCSIRM